MFVPWLGLTSKASQLHDIMKCMPVTEHVAAMSIGNAVHVTRFITVSDDPAAKFQPRHAVEEASACRAYVWGSDACASLGQQMLQLSELSPAKAAYLR